VDYLASTGAAFRDRAEAGKKLATELARFSDPDVLVLAIPRGGVEVGYQVADKLDAEFSIIIVRKLPFPDNTEAGFGAIAEQGGRYIHPEASRWLSPETIERVIDEQRSEVSRRVRVLRQGEPLPEIAGCTVILVDDGIAMGSTMRAAIQLCREQGAGRIIVAAPVSSRQVAAELMALVDDVVILEQPPVFRAVAQVYENWYDVSDGEVLEILAQWREDQGKGGRSLALG
jgi:putative phosphoribosyl transferase